VQSGGAKAGAWFVGAVVALARLRAFARDWHGGPAVFERRQPLGDEDTLSSDDLCDPLAYLKPVGRQRDGVASKLHSPVRDSTPESMCL
jgi:hypothetical protein